jgi:CubicO group peptidase (beta-lactamase class C family)
MPHLGVTCLSLLIFSGSAEAQTLAVQTDSVMRAAEAKGFSGVVRLEKDGQTVLAKGYGKANRATGIPFTPSTVVQIGSNTKDFTAVAILQLQDRRKLNVTDQLGKFFPDAPADKRGITLLQLMMHRAGFPLGLGGDFEPVTRDQLVRNAMNFKLLFAPGTREKYSNTGYSILAAVIEKVSGKNYDEYVRENILHPLGLTQTGFLLPHFAMNRLAHGYAPGGRDAGTMLEKPHASDGPYWNLRGNGGMLSTVSDMHAFYKALFETNKLLTPASRDIMFHPNQPIGLAGSDLVNFFLYERDPIAHVEMIIASTNAEQKSPVVRRELARVFGLPLDVGGDNDGPADKPLEPGKPPAPAVASVIQGLVAAINKGDEKALVAFVTDNFESGPGAPTPAERVQRIGGIHGNLGVITIQNMSDGGDGPVRVSIRTEKVGGGTMMVNIGRSAPFKIKSVGLQIGSD